MPLKLVQFLYGLFLKEQICSLFPLKVVHIFYCYRYGWTAYCVTEFETVIRVLILWRFLFIPSTVPTKEYSPNISVYQYYTIIRYTGVAQFYFTSLVCILVFSRPFFDKQMRLSTP